MKQTEKLFKETGKLIKNAGTISFELFKIMIPVVIAVKILQEFGLIGYIAAPLGPIMKTVGLPPETGLIWATALINNIYSGLIVFLSLSKDLALTSAQATILGAMILVAHSLPVELRVVQSSGPRIIFQGLARLFGAFALGFILHFIFSELNVLNNTATVLLTPDKTNIDETILQWAIGEARNLISIYFVILGLLIVMRILSALKILTAMDFLLRPVLKLMGIGPKASALTVVGLTMGLSYGGGMIIHEVKSGKISHKDVFYSLTLMSLCHSLIEDTLLLMMIGGHISGLFWGRLVFSMLFVAILVQLTKILPEKWNDKIFWVNTGLTNYATKQLD
ncbi:hypothetical protein [Maridesulfovibrio bastinii]|uniref:hypothetical protein n=1 Tax=Maridesulfovibrio bastinii TaxID=47157 RepID=UPI00041973DB|nr:hypothetical protein [Maridesulfovibrio bastinii]